MAANIMRNDANSPMTIVFGKMLGIGSDFEQYSQLALLLPSTSTTLITTMVAAYVR